MHLLEKSSKFTIHVTVPNMEANSRKTVKLNDLPWVGNTDLSVQVHSGEPIITERSIYWTGELDNDEVCHCSIGLSSPHSVFYLPDGQTTDGFETWTLVQNPNDVAVTVEITYLPQGGGDTVTYTDEIPAKSRKTYNMAGVDGEYPGIEGRASIIVETQDFSRPVIVERSMYWNSRGTGTDSIGGFMDII